MRTIKFNYDFLDVPCEKDKKVMVGSMTCKGCKHNKTSGIRMRYGGEIMCNYDENIVNDREIIYWSCDEHQERLSCMSKDEAIEYYLDDIEEDKEPDTVKVYGFARQEIADNEDGIGILEDFLANLDENYGDPDGDCTEITDKMKKAAKVFVDAVISEYEVWTCDCVYEEEVDLGKWLENRKLKIDIPNEYYKDFETSIEGRLIELAGVPVLEKK